MLILLLLLVYFNKKQPKSQFKLDGQHPLYSNLQLVHHKSIKSLNNSLKQYFILKINDPQTFFKTELFQNNQDIFTPSNCVSPPTTYRAFLNDSQLDLFLNSDEILIYNVPDELNIFKTLKQPKRTKEQNFIKKTLSSKTQIHQFLIESTDEFPQKFGKFGEIGEIAPGLYSLRPYSPNIDQFQEEILNSNIIYSIGFLPKAQKLNRFSNGYIQTGSLQMSTIDNQVTSFTPLKYQGEGEIITISDSGLAFGPTWFAQEGDSYPIDTFNTSMRKIIYYKSYSNIDFSDQSGHGTHVVGIAIGDAQNHNSLHSLYNGAAPKAKGMIIDLEGNEGDMSTDGSLGKTLENMQLYGSYITTNSWTLDPSAYGDNAANVERLRIVGAGYNRQAVENSNIIFLFAAGNSESYYTIGIPGSCKNMLTVGALDALINSKLNLTQSFTLNQMKFKATIGDDDKTEYEITCIKDSLSQRDFEFKSFILEMSNEKQPEAIYNLNVVPASQSGENTVAYTTSCAEMQTALSKHAKVILVDNTKVDEFKSCSKTGQSSAFGISADSATIAKFLNKQITVTPQVSPEFFRFPGISDYSSRGPNYRQMIKPEIVAPGTNITSASTFPQTALEPMSGTSMSTPLVAGAIALLREYLIKAKNFEKNKIPSHLIKAILIASADKTNPKIPDVTYGFGCLNLANVIPDIQDEMAKKGLVNADASKYVKMEHISLKIMENTTHLFKFTINSNARDVRVAFSYLDTPASNDDMLNIKAHLNVELPNRQKLLFPIGDDMEDIASSSERIYIPKDEIVTGVHTVIITTSEANFAKIEPYNSINLSLVILGDVSNLEEININSQSSTDFFSWSRYCFGTQVSSTTPEQGIQKCQCDEFSTGSLCQHQYKYIEYGKSLSENELKPLVPQYLYTIIPENMQQLTFAWVKGDDGFLMLNFKDENELRTPNSAGYSTGETSRRGTIKLNASVYNENRTEFIKDEKLFITYTNFGSQPSKVTPYFSELPAVKEKKPIDIKYIIIGGCVLTVIVIVVIIVCNVRIKKKARVTNASDDSAIEEKGMTGKKGSKKVKKTKKATEKKNNKKSEKEEKKHKKEHEKQDKHEHDEHEHDKHEHDKHEHDKHEHDHDHKRRRSTKKGKNEQFTPELYQSEGDINPDAIPDMGDGNDNNNNNMLALMNPEVLANLTPEEQLAMYGIQGVSGEQEIDMFEYIQQNIQDVNQADLFNPYQPSIGQEQISPNLPNSEIDEQINPNQNDANIDVINPFPNNAMNDDAHPLQNVLDMSDQQMSPDSELPDLDNQQENQPQNVFDIQPSENDILNEQQVEPIDESDDPLDPDQDPDPEQGNRPRPAGHRRRNNYDDLLMSDDQVEP